MEIRNSKNNSLYRFFFFLFLFNPFRLCPLFSFQLRKKQVEKEVRNSEIREIGHNLTLSFLFFHLILSFFFFFPKEVT